MGLMLKQRIVFLGNQMDDFVADAIISQLLLLDAVDPKKEIRLFINCPGGSISAAMGIFDAIQLCRADVSTICFGLAASTAAIVLAGGTRGRRLAMPNSRIMMHQPLGGASGQAIDVEIQAKEVMYHKSNITRLLSEISGRSYEQVEKDIDRDRYMSPIEAMEYGIIDGVIDKDAIIAINELPVVSERVKPRKENLAAMENPRKFLSPEIPDDEIY
jgi:ATP-dependent Clp protease protease subunit